MAVNRQAIDMLYSEAVALADQARGWFDGAGQHWRQQLPPDAQALVATEGLEVTSRLMAVMSWLLDPAHGHDGLAHGHDGSADGHEGPAMRPFLAETGADRPLLPVLAGTPSGDIALASRQLAARVAALANDGYSGDRAP